MKVERITSGISGLDQYIEGGFEKNSAILIAGGGGSGKTILGTQFLIHGIEKYNETGIYISFEESKKKFYMHMKRFGWDLERYENEGRFIFITYSPRDMADIVSTGSRSLEKSIKEVNAKRIVIDSLSAYTVLFEKESEQREMLVSLFAMIERWDCTTVVIAEEDQYPERHQSNVMGFMADAIILLYTILKNNKDMIRGLQVFKMRGTDHEYRILPLAITEKGIILKTGSI